MEIGSILSIFERTIDSIHQDKKKYRGQFSMFETIDTKVSEDNLPDLKKFNQKTLLTMEKKC